MTFLSHFRRIRRLPTLPKTFLIFALSGVFVIVLLQTWALSPELVTAWIVRMMLAAIAVIIILEYCSYLHRLSMLESHRRFSVRQVFVMTTVVAILSANGYLLDALMIPLLVAATLIVGPITLRLIRRRYPTRSLQQTIALSVLLFLLYAVLSAITSVVAILLLPSDPDWLEGAILLKAALVPTALISLLFLGKDYGSGLQMLTYGVPLGVPITIGIWAVAGAAVGAVAHFSFQLRIKERENLKGHESIQTK